MSNSFANLCLPLFAWSEPVPTTVQDMSRFLWDWWILQGDFTVQVRTCWFALLPACGIFPPSIRIRHVVVAVRLADIAGRFHDADH